MSSVTACNCPQKPLDPACPRAKSSRQLGQQRQMSNVHRYWAGEKWINLHQKPNQNDSRPIIHISSSAFHSRKHNFLVDSDDSSDST